MKYTAYEGGGWLEWPIVGKPSDDYLDSIVLGNSHAEYESVKFHSIKLDDGQEWDSINGFRRQWRVHCPTLKHWKVYRLINGKPKLVRREYYV